MSRQVVFLSSLVALTVVVLSGFSCQPSAAGRPLTPRELSGLFGGQIGGEVPCARCLVDTDCLSPAMSTCSSASQAECPSAEEVVHEEGTTNNCISHDPYHECHHSSQTHICKTTWSCYWNSEKGECKPVPSGRTEKHIPEECSTHVTY